MADSMDCVHSFQRSLHFAASFLQNQKLVPWPASVVLLAAPLNPGSDWHALLCCEALMPYMDEECGTVATGAYKCVQSSAEYRLLSGCKRQDFGAPLMLGIPFESGL